MDIASGEILIASTEILARTDVGLAGVALALVSGAAAVLSLTTGLSSTLVGVMVAVALLPPTATMGMLVGAGHMKLAGGAALLLAVNVVCVIISAKLMSVTRRASLPSFTEPFGALCCWCWCSLSMRATGCLRDGSAT